MTASGSPEGPGRKPKARGSTGTDAAAATAASIPADSHPSADVSALDKLIALAAEDKQRAGATSGGAKAAGKGARGNTARGGGGGWGSSGGWSGSTRRGGGWVAGGNGWSWGAGDWGHCATASAAADPDDEAAQRGGGRRRRGKGAPEEPPLASGKGRHHGRPAEEGTAVVEARASPPPAAKTAGEGSRKVERSGATESAELSATAGPTAAADVAATAPTAPAALSAKATEFVPGAAVVEENEYQRSEYGATTAYGAYDGYTGGWADYAAFGDAGAADGALGAGPGGPQPRGSVSQGLPSWSEAVSRAVQSMSSTAFNLAVVAEIYPLAIMKLPGARLLSLADEAVEGPAVREAAEAAGQNLGGTVLVYCERSKKRASLEQPAWLANSGLNLAAIEAMCVNERKDATNPTVGMKVEHAGLCKKLGIPNDGEYLTHAAMKARLAELRAAVTARSL